MNLRQLSVDQITNQDSFCNQTFTWINLCECDISYRGELVDKPPKEKKLTSFDWINRTTFELLLLNKDMLLEEDISNNKIRRLFIEEEKLYDDVLSNQFGESKDDTLSLKISMGINLALGNISKAPLIWEQVVKQYDSHMLKEQLIEEIGGVDRTEQKKMKL
jgi:hypothetical protein